MHQARLHSVIVLAVALAAALAGASLAQQQPCSTTSIEATPPPTSAVFHPHRPGGPFGSSLRYRDAEFMWDALYGTGLTESIKKTLDRLARAVVETTGTSPVVVDAHNSQAVYDYLNREGRTWSADRQDLLNGLRIGNRSYPAADYSHVDAYITDWAHDRAGQWPAAWETADEDSTSSHARGIVLHDNSVHFGGPPRSSPYDTTGTGWTAPGSVAFTGFNHEMAHGFTTSTGTVGGFMEGELWSAGAEAVGGSRSFDTSEVPYTWSLMAWCSPCTAPDLNDPNFNNRFSLSNYQARTSFMAYVAYNFLNADTSRTLAGMRDDLMYKWVRSVNTSPAGLVNVLSDASCATCAQKNYFRRDNIPMTGVERLAMLHHNWRVANFVNNPNLDQGQYGYPAWGGFSPTANQSSWRAVDGTPKTDIVAIPAIVNLAPATFLHDTTLQGTRSFRGVSHPMALVPYSANYWVVRPTGSLTTSDQDLVVRVSPRAFYLQCNSIGSGDYGVRLMASAVAYDRFDGGGEESNLWQFPANAVYSTAVEWTVADSAAEDIRLVVPSFGMTRKAVVVVVTLADGQLPSWAAAQVGYEEAMPYRLDIGVANTAGLTQTAARLSTTAPGPADWPAWSPTSDELAYSEYDGHIASYSQIYRRRLDGSPPSRVFPQAVNQYNPDWSPRGDRIVWTNYTAVGQLDLWIADLSVPNGPGWQLTNQPGASTFAAFQPNGQGIAYILERAAPADTAWELRWIGVDGTGDRLITKFPQPSPTTPPLLPVAPRWTRDGTHLVVCDYVTHRFLRCPASGGPPVLVSGPALDFVSFDPSPGRGRLAITSTAPLPNAAPEGPWCQIRPVPRSLTSGRPALLDTAQASRDTSFRFVGPGVGARNLRWSPDGVRLAYSRLRTGTSDGDVWVGRATWDRAPTFDAPYAGELVDQTIPACVPFSLGPLRGTDPDGEPVTFEAAMLPSSAQFTWNNTFRWQYPQPGEHYVVFRVLDTVGGVQTKVIKFTVYNNEVCDWGLEEGGGGGGGLAAGRAGSFSLRPGTDLGGGNSVLDGSDPDAWNDQVVRCTSPVVTPEGGVSVSLRAGGGSAANLDRVELLMVDHADDAIAVAVDGGVATGVPAPVSVATREDGSPVNLPGESSDDPLLCSDGTTLVVGLPNSVATMVLVDCRRLGPLVRDSLAGVAVQVEGDGGWTTVGRAHPRKEWDVLAVALPPAGHARLLFVGDALVRSVRVLIPDGAAAGATVARLAPVEASDDAALSLLRAADDSALRLEPGSSIVLTFPAQPGSGVARSCFLAVRGRYIESAPVSPSSASAARVGPEAPPSLGFARPRPNPFTRTTTLEYSLPAQASVRIEVLDTQGRRVRTLVDARTGPGRFALAWDGRDAVGRPVAPGVYLARMIVGGERFSHRLVLTP